jgi:hypothetical protein
MDDIAKSQSWAAVMSSVTIAFPIQEKDAQESLDAAHQLANALRAHVVLFVNQPSNQLQALLQASALTWVDLGLGGRVNRYIGSNAAVAAWNPWGYKSGPNYDFFAILDWCQNANADWVLLGETDLLPIGESLDSRVSDLLSSAQDRWVVGAEPSTESKRLLDPRIRDHINGAAFYRVSSKEFGVFRRQVWIPSLIALIKYFPFFAYDCIAAPGVWDLLSDHLRDSWERHRLLFHRTELMVNLSNIKVSRDFVATRAAAPTAPLFIHAKLQQ